MKSQQKNKYFLFLTIYFVITLIILTFNIGGDIVGTISEYITNLVVLFFCLVLLVKHKLNNNMKRFVTFLFSGIIFWIIGDLIWEFSNLQVVSFADISYYIGYIALSIGMVYGALSIQENIFKTNKTKIVYSIGVLYLIIFFFSLWDFNETISTNFATSGYVLADIALLVLTMIMMFESISNKYKNIVWSSTSLFIGTILITFADILYALNYEITSRDKIVSITFLFAYSLYCLSLIYLVDQTKKK